MPRLAKFLGTAARFLTTALYAGSAVLFLFSAVAACQLRLALPREPFVWPDSFTYIQPGVALESTGAWLGGIRQFFYPAFIYVVTHLTGHSSAVATAQHLIGWLSGLVFLTAWWLALQPLGRGRLAHALGLALGLIGLHLLWTSPVVLVYECYVMPEALFMSASTAELLALVVTLRLITSPAPSRFRLITSFAMLTGTSIGLYFIVPRWGFGVALVPAVIALLAIALRQRAGTVLAGLGTGALAALLLFAGPELWLGRRAPPHTHYFLPMALFGMHAGMMQDEIGRELAAPRPAFDPEFLRRCQKAIAREYLRSANTPASNPPYPSLGFSPEEIIFGNSVVAQVVTYFRNDPVKIKAFFVHFYFAAWQNQPGTMIGKTLDELNYIYTSPSPAFALGPCNFPLPIMIDRSLQIAETAGYAVEIAPSKIWSTYAPRLRRADPAGAIEHGAWAFRIERNLADVFIYLGLFAAAAGLVILLPRFRATAEGGICLLAFAATLPAFSGYLTVATLHSLYPSRYRETDFILALFSVLIALLALIALSAAGFRRLFRLPPVQS